MSASRPASTGLSPLERAALPLLLAVAAVLRVRESFRTPLWYDELYTRAAVDRPWDAVMEVMRNDVHPPLHFAISWLWRFAGDSDLAVRSSSMVAGLAGVAVAGLLARECFGPRAGMLAAALVALHPYHIYASQEARSYPLLWLMLSLSAWGAWRWCEHGRRTDAALFVLGSALALWTHYLAGVALAVQWVWGLARLRREQGRMLAWTGLHVAVAALFAPVLPLWWTQLHRVEVDHWMPRPTLADLFETLRKLAFGAVYLAPVVLALAVAPFTERRLRRAATFALVAGPLVVLLCWGLGAAGVRVFTPRYMMLAIPALMMLVAAGAMRLPGRAAGVAAALLLALSLRAAILRPPSPEAESLRRMRAALEPQLRPGDRVFHADAHTLLFGLRYWPQQRHRLLLMGQRMPYYEGHHVVADSLRGEATEVADAVRNGERWWGLAVHQPGLDVSAASALFDSAAAAPPARFDVVKMWSGPAR
ncbi:MAG: glycosyltransferase family 39 protein [Candidatus Eisenbacteria bacterium]|nr:glycosyltransferase family 39 protein [Candidatus Eisenbacteria bacterium]